VVDVECESGLREDLYHYTDFGALKSVYEKGEIWATNSRYLNDISEMQLGPKAIMGVLLWPFVPDQTGRELVESKRAKLVAFHNSGTRFKDLSPESQAEVLTDIEVVLDLIRPIKGIFDERELLRELGEACKHAVNDTTCFVFSLSKEPDQLSQWRAYAKDGVCIKFSADALRRNLYSAPGQRARIESVRYYDETAALEEHSKLENYAKPIINSTRERRAELIAAGVDEGTRHVTIGQELITQLAFIKDIHFEEEQEVRIVVQGNPDHFTAPHRYGIVPRMKLPITSDAIKSVIVGPSAHSELRVQSLRTFFDNWGFKNEPSATCGHIQVDKSSIPYRDW
jgi:hypothetical protein